MNSRDAANDLLTLAREDLSFAETLHAAEGISERPVGFHAQQAVEKALKAALTAQDAEFPFTHDIAVLIELCEDAGIEVPENLADADHLTPYAVAIRYGLSDPSAVDPERAIAWAGLATEWADAQLHPST